MSCLAAQIRATSRSFGYVFINRMEDEPINETSARVLCTGWVKKSGKHHPRLSWEQVMVDAEARVSVATTFPPPPGRQQENSADRKTPCGSELKPNLWRMVPKKNGKVLWVFLLLLMFLFVKRIKVVYISVEGGECKWAKCLYPELSF